MKSVPGGSSGTLFVLCKNISAPGEVPVEEEIKEGHAYTCFHGFKSKSRTPDNKI
jgi:hypothetical protein